MFAIKTPTEPRTEPQVAEERRDKSRPGPASEAAAARRAAARRLAVNIRAAQPPSPAQAETTNIFLFGKYFSEDF